MKAVLVVGILCAPSVLAVQTPNPLAGPPSESGPHIDRIKSLPNDSWLELDAPAPDPQWAKRAVERNSFPAAAMICTFWEIYSSIGLTQISLSAPGAVSGTQESAADWLQR